MTKVTNKDINIENNTFFKNDQSEPISEKMVIASNIAFFRKKLGISQTELAKKLQYSNKNISKWELGETTPDIFTLKKLAEIFGVTVDTLTSPLLHENLNAIKTKSAVPFRWKLYMLLLANAIFFLLTCIAWFILKTLDVTTFNINYLFLYILPAVDMSVFVFLCCIRKKVDVVTLSLFGWLMVLCFYFSFSYAANIGYVFIIAVGWQVFAPILAKLINSGKIIRFNRLILKKLNKKTDK